MIGVKEVGRPQQVPTFKCALIGHEGCGKSSLVKRHLTGAFVQQYVPTRGLVVTNLQFNTNRGPICFETWEAELGEYEKSSIFFRDLKCAILMFDVGLRDPLINFDSYYSLFKRVPSYALKSICGNKTDIQMSNENPLRLTFFNFTKMSVKANSNIDKPFVYFARRLLKDPALEFIPKTEMLPAQLKLSVQELLHKKELPSKALASEK
ncbi:GTP-binding nuclear protein spi1-like [Drosophila guanche]|uniref:Blast:GTP-binding nuclear protein spi1 n=1 Tax=Drosophila guanche TaxID=7266 RepID=A0A3B0KIT1_DROGU|nr:GTP-binding nuclear protein spi1-like [Drosophila guanche]SPP86349.1 blast:GTP-binding nuclear protein spi1 [Drosophila guanche]